MPRQKVRHPVFDYVSKEEASLLLRQLDWKELEQCLGRTSLTKEIRANVESHAFVIRTWRKSPPRTEVRQKILRFKKKAEKLRLFLGEIGEGPLPKWMIKSPKTVEAEVSGSSPRYADPYIERMKKALDTVIAVSDKAKSELTGLSYERWLAVMGYIIRNEFVKAELPHKVRKDTDKIWRYDQNSPFVKFYLELLKQIGMPWQGRNRAR